VTASEHREVDRCWGPEGEPGIKGPAWSGPQAAPVSLPAREGGLDSLPHNCAACRASRKTLTSIECYGTAQWDAHRRRIATCGTSAGVFLVRTSGGRMEIAPARCHSRFHDGCRQSGVIGKIEALAARAGDGLALHFGTLTFRARRDRWARDACWWRLWSRWARWRGLMAHAGIPTGEYVAVVEAHEGMAPDYLAEGWPHLHVVALRRPWTASEARTAKALWVRCGGGHQVRWEVVERNPCYIAKYVGKQSRLPETVKALLLWHKIRMTNSSPGLQSAKQVTKTRRTWKRMTQSQLRSFVAAQNNT